MLSKQNNRKNISKAEWEAFIKENNYNIQDMQKVKSALNNMKQGTTNWRSNVFLTKEERRDFQAFIDNRRLKPRDP